MNIGLKLVAGYFVIAMLYTFYGWFITPYGGHGYAYNLGIAIFWPVIIFPGLGKVVGGILMVAIIFSLMRK